MLPGLLWFGECGVILLSMGPMRGLSYTVIIYSKKWRGKGEQKAVISLVDSEGIILLPRSGTLKTEQTYTEYILAAVRKDEQVTPTSHGQTRALRFWVC